MPIHLNRCRCYCHRYPEGVAKHIIPCCGKCFACGQSLIKSMSTHLRAECPKRVGPSETKVA